MDFASPRKKGFSLETDPLNNRVRTGLSSFRWTSCFSLYASHWLLISNQSYLSIKADVSLENLSLQLDRRYPFRGENVSFQESVWFRLFYVLGKVLPNCSILAKLTLLQILFDLEQWSANYDLRVKSSLLPLLVISELTTVFKFLNGWKNPKKNTSWQMKVYEIQILMS